LPRIKSHPEKAFGEARLSVFEVGRETSLSAPVEISRFYVLAGDATPWDQHAVREIWILGSGSGQLETPDGPVFLVQGDAFYFEPHQCHRITNTGDQPLEIISIWWPT
jgi:mannose-6-phosphate isomerase-like protein (cupin superfamily)